MQYQKKLQSKFDSLRIHKSKNSVEYTVNYERDIKYWYHERMKVIQQCHMQYMKKLQREFGANSYGKQEKEALLN